MTILTEFDGLEVESVELRRDITYIKFKNSDKELRIVPEPSGDLTAVVMKSNGWYTVFA